MGQEVTWPLPYFYFCSVTTNDKEFTVSGTQQSVKQFLLNCELNSLLKLPNASFPVIFLFGILKCGSPFPWHNQCHYHLYFLYLLVAVLKIANYTYVLFHPLGIIKLLLYLYAHFHYRYTSLIHFLFIIILITVDQGKKKNVHVNLTEKAEIC